MLGTRVYATMPVVDDAVNDVGSSIGFGSGNVFAMYTAAIKQKFRIDLSQLSHRFERDYTRALRGLAGGPCICQSIWREDGRSFSGWYAPVLVGKRENSGLANLRNFGVPRGAPKCMG